MRCSPQSRVLAGQAPSLAREDRADGTPEPGGLSWPEITELLRVTAERRRVVAADIVELSPIPGIVAPNFLCAKLAYKLLTYRFQKHPKADRGD